MDFDCGARRAEENGGAVCAAGRQGIRGTIAGAGAAAAGASGGLGSAVWRGRAASAASELEVPLPDPIRKCEAKLVQDAAIATKRKTREAAGRHSSQRSKEKEEGSSSRWSRSRVEIGSGQTSNLTLLAFSCFERSDTSPGEVPRTIHSLPSSGIQVGVRCASKPSRDDRAEDRPQLSDTVKRRGE